jgi:hypothetical protein
MLTNVNELELLSTYSKSLNGFVAEDVIEIFRSVTELVDPPLDPDVVHLDCEIDE